MSGADTSRNPAKRGATIQVPPIDAAIIFLPKLIERDYVARGQFPTLRAGHAMRRDANYWQLATTIDIASECLADADAQLTAGVERTWLRKAYESLRDELPGVIERAQTRHATHFACPQPELLGENDWFVEWRGTADQFRTIGIGHELDFPSEFSARRRWSARTTDPMGCSVRIEQSDTWPWMFIATVTISDDLRKAREMLRKTAAEAEAAQLERLRGLPVTKDDFRRAVASRYWRAVDEVLESLDDLDGYRLSEEDRERFRTEASDAYWTIRNGAVEGRSPREKLRKVVAAHAQSDDRLQGMLRRAQAHAHRDLAIGRTLEGGA